MAGTSSLHRGTRQHILWGQISKAFISRTGVKVVYHRISHQRGVEVFIILHHTVRLASLHNASFISVFSFFFINLSPSLFLLFYSSTLFLTWTDALYIYSHKTKWIKLNSIIFFITHFILTGSWTYNLDIRSQQRITATTVAVVM